MKVRVHICREVELEVADKFAKLSDSFWDAAPEMRKLAEDLEAIVREATGISDDDPAESIVCIEDSDGGVMLDEVMLEW